MPKWRKHHGGDAGVLYEVENRHVPGTSVVVYIAEAQGIPSDGGGKYAVVCDAHSSIVQTNSKRDARLVARFPENFCEGCNS